MLSGAAQLGRRWNTVSSAACSATTGMAWIAVAPVPMMPTRLPSSATRLVRPVKRMEGLALEVLDPLDARHRRRRQQPQGHDDEARGELASVAREDVPPVLVLVKVRGFHVAVELHVLPQTELVGDVVQVLQVLGLTGEGLLPVPLVEELLRERVPVGIALGVEAGAGIAVPIPGAAEVTAGIEHGGVDPEIGEALDLVDAGDAGADDDDLVVLVASHCVSH